MPARSTVSAASPAELDHLETWIFDLDNTLYSVTPGMLAQIDDLMGSFISAFLEVDRDEARRIQKGYFREFGLTLRGLIVRHGLDPREYVEHMSQTDLSHIEANPDLAAAISRLPGRKVIYTNASGRHTQDVLARLGMADHFDEIHDIEAADYIPKPDVRAYRDMCDRYGIDPERAIMVDDITHNLAPAAEIGMTTVWKKSDAHWAKDVVVGDHIHHVVEDVLDWLESPIADR